jgi:hypothetical protein
MTKVYSNRSNSEPSKITSDQKAAAKARRKAGEPNGKTAKKLAKLYGGTVSAKA